MLYLLISLVGLGIVAAILGYKRNRGELPHVREIPADCCGQHEVCERNSLLAAVSRQITYYEDEELDSYRGTDADAYEEEAIDAFREVLYTLRETEVAGWLRSLQLRKVNLPDSLKDEALLIVCEQRKHA